MTIFLSIVTGNPFSDGLDKFSAIFIAQKSAKIWAFCEFNKCCYWCTDHRETVQVCREREEPLADKLLVEVRNKVCWKLFLWSNQELTVTFTADSAKSNWAVPQPGLVFGINSFLSRNQNVKNRKKIFINAAMLPQLISIISDTVYTCIILQFVRTWWLRHIIICTWCKKSMFFSISYKDFHKK